MDDELRRLLNKLPELDDRARARDHPIVRKVDQQAAAPAAGILAQRGIKGPPHGLLEALKRLFQLQD